MRTSRSGFSELRRPVLRDACCVAVAAIVMFLVFVTMDAFEAIAAWSRRYERLELDELLVLLAGTHLLMMVFGYRRSRDLKQNFRDRKNAERALVLASLRDSLTGLPNRDGLTAAADRALEERERRGAEVAVLLLDLDRFKDVNDTLGHAVGDELLREVGERLRASVGSAALVTRFGGDEFVLLLAPIKGVASATALGQHLLTVLREPFTVRDMALEVDASIGVAITSPEKESVGTLLQHADVAMYRAKAGRSGVEVFTTAMAAQSPAQLSVFGDLRRAVAPDCTPPQLVLHYQPKVALSTGRVTGVEALVRWQHPERGLIPPSEFLELAEQTGLVRQLTSRVLEMAIADASVWRANGGPSVVAVNLSPRVLLDASFPQEVASALSGRLPPSALELEITETSAMTDPSGTLRVLRHLCSLGVALSVDDYGTGYSSLAYLTRLPVTTLKLDRSFLLSMEVDSGSRAIVRSTIALARELGLTVVAEGVETGETWSQLAGMGCDEAQGFWLSRPVPAEQVPAVVRSVEQRLAQSRDVLPVRPPRAAGGR